MSKMNWLRLIRISTLSMINKIQRPENGCDWNEGSENRNYIGHEGKKCSDYGSNSAEALK
jgi:hypothetical protein